MAPVSKRSSVLGIVGGSTSRFVLHPFPCRLDYQPEILKFRLPAQFRIYSIRAGDKHRRVTGPSLGIKRSDFPAGNFSRRLNNPVNGVAVTAAAEVKDRASLPQDFERLYVRPSEVDHVNIIADACTVAGRVIITEDLDLFTLAGRSLQYDRNEVGLGVVHFAAALARSGRDKISK